MSRLVLMISCVWLLPTPPHKQPRGLSIYLVNNFLIPRPLSTVAFVGGHTSKKAGMKAWEHGYSMNMGTVWTWVQYEHGPAYWSTILNWKVWYRDYRIRIGNEDLPTAAVYQVLGCAHIWICILYKCLSCKYCTPCSSEIMHTEDWGKQWVGHSKCQIEGGVNDFQ